MISEDGHILLRLYNHRILVLHDYYDGGDVMMIDAKGVMKRNQEVLIWVVKFCPLLEVFA
jgi:hypothetical protein